jgi:hypothetical protein
MKALPLDWSEEGEQCAGIVCPDCSGAVSVRIEGARRTMFFQCRVGHTFGLVDLLASKEQIIEARLWRALYALEEYADLLDDLGPANAELPRRELIQRRNAMARQHARALRMRAGSFAGLNARIHEVEVTRELLRAEASCHRARQIGGRAAELLSQSSSPS